MKNQEPTPHPPEKNMGLLRFHLWLPINITHTLPDMGQLVWICPVSKIIYFKIFKLNLTDDITKIRLEDRDLHLAIIAYKMRTMTMIVMQWPRNREVPQVEVQKTSSTLVAVNIKLLTDIVQSSLIITTLTLESYQVSPVLILNPTHFSCRTWTSSTAHTTN